jgi:hypothetical protein
MQENRTPKTSNRWRIIMAKYDNNVIEAIFAHHDFMALSKG